jgi:hypothetical protein
MRIYGQMHTTVRNGQPIASTPGLIVAIEGTDLRRMRQGRMTLGNLQDHGLHGADYTVCFVLSRHLHRHIDPDTLTTEPLMIF